jgi:hypothetical protein
MKLVSIKNTITFLLTNETYEWGPGRREIVFMNLCNDKNFIFMSPIRGVTQSHSMIWVA